MERGRDALRTSDYTQAEILFRSAFESTIRDNPKDGRYLEAMSALCDVYTQTGKVEKCDEQRRSALAFLVSALGPGDSLVVRFVIDQVAGMLVQHRYDDSEWFLKYVISVSEKLLGDDHPILGVYLNNLGTLYYYQGWFKKSENCLLRALEIDARHLGPTHPDVASDLHNLGELYLQTGQPNKARPMFERAEEIRELADSVSSVDDTANAEERFLAQGASATAGLDSYVLAGQAIESRDYTGAVDLLNRSLKEADEAGESGTWMEFAMEQLAAILHQLRRYDEAEPIHKRLIAFRENTRGNDDPLVAVTLNNLALVYAVGGRHSDAVICYERALGICEQASTKDWRQIALLNSNLAGSYRALKKLPEAERHYKVALLLRSDSLGDQSTEVASTLRALAGVYQDMNRREDAKIALNQAADIQRASQEGSSEDLIAILWPLGELYQYDRKFDQAESCYVEILAVAQSGSTNPELVERVSSRLATLYGSRGQYGRADQMFTHIISSLEKAHGPDYPQLANALNSRAMFLAEQGRLKEAEPLERRALEVLERNFGPNDERLITVLSNLGVILRGLGNNWEADVVEARALQLKLKK